MFFILAKILKKSILKIKSRVEKLLRKTQKVNKCKTFLASSNIFLCIMDRAARVYTCSNPEHSTYFLKELNNQRMKVCFCYS